MARKKTVVLLAPDVFDHAGAAGYLKISTTYLYQLRYLEKGPLYTRQARALYYTKQALDAWDKERKAKKATREAKRKANQKRSMKKAA